MSKEKKKPAYLYLCDREKCENCNEDCFHTTDLSHAANRGQFNEFEKLGGDFWEKKNEN